MKILNTNQMRRSEQECAEIGLTSAILMENAGRAVAEQVKHIVGNINNKHIIILIGPGNNGGDGLVTARYLHDWGAQITLLLFSERSSSDQNLKLIHERQINCVNVSARFDITELSLLLKSAGIVIDSLFGTGKLRRLDNHYSQVLETISKVKQQLPQLQIIALDLPSGLNADSGSIDPACLKADETITLGFPKMGLFSPSASDWVGRLSIVDIGIPAHLVDNVQNELITENWARATLPSRPLQANKGTFGRVLVNAGSKEYIGAAFLACTGAIRVGAGIVTLATPASLHAIMAVKLTEVTHLPLPETKQGTIMVTKAAQLIHNNLSRFDVLLSGCGIGQGRATSRFIRSLLMGTHLALPVVLDADALNILAKITNWWQQLTNDAILTPHPGEMARLAGMSVDNIQLGRINIARAMASKWRKIVVLKGAHTVVASPDGRCQVSPFCNPGLATGGTGDVLSGIISGLLAQKVPLFEAATLGVFLHGKAGEIIKNKYGDTGMMASDLLPALPLAIMLIKAQNVINN